MYTSDCISHRNLQFLSLTSLTVYSPKPACPPVLCVSENDVPSQKHEGHPKLLPLAHSPPLPPQTSKRYQVLQMLLLYISNTQHHFFLSVALVQTMLPLPPIWSPPKISKLFTKAFGVLHDLVPANISDFTSATHLPFSHSLAFLFFEHNKFFTP